MQQEISFDSRYSKSYQSYEGAQKAADKILAEFKPQLDDMGLRVRYIVSYDKASGRLIPAFVGAQQASIWFIQKGFPVIS